MFLVYAVHSGNLTWRPHHGLLILLTYTYLLHTFWHYPANGANSDWNVLNVVRLCCWSVILETSRFLREEIETFTQTIVLSCVFVYLNVFFFMGVCAVQVVCRRPLVFAQQHYNQFQAAQSCKSGYFPLQLEELWLLLTLLWIMALTWCKKKCLETLETSVYILHIILNGFPSV